MHYLAACCIAENFEPPGRKILLYYHEAIEAFIDKAVWDAVDFLPWPRKRPLPGLFGIHRRLLQNLRKVAKLVGPCDSVTIHAGGYGAEATNYFVLGLGPLVGANTVCARIIPEGVDSTRRYPLSFKKRWSHKLRVLRRIVSPELKFRTFSGDHTGADAAFVDRIYTLAGLPHQYRPEKVTELPALVRTSAPVSQASSQLRALVIGQPLTGSNLLAEADLPRVTDRIHAWLADQGVTFIHYKGHPRDRNNELMGDGDEQLMLEEPIERYLARTHYDFIVGARSTVLLFARQIYGPEVRVLAFGWDLLIFKSPEERKDLEAVFASSGVELV
ncbi:MAG: hypothetical protein FIA97_13530 [Methylococcaceae bacterium]|nr:hypothetical protein [Methylococcaceae bacterium]